MTAQMLLQQEDARRRLHDSRRLECTTLGLPDPGEFEPMGPITVSGDSKTENHYHPSPQPTTPTTPTTTPTTTGPLRKFVWPAILGGALLGGGAGAMALYNYFTDKPETTVNNPPQDWRLGIQVTDQP